MGQPGEEQVALATELDRVTDGFMAFDHDWRFTFLNSRAAALFERPAAELVGKSILELFPEVVGTPIHRHGERALREQRVQIYEQFVPSLGRWFEGRIYPARDGISVFFNDITDRVAAERERAELEERVHRGQRLESLGRLVGGVAHDFNNMLSLILNHAELVCDGVADRPAVYADAAQIRDTAERAADLVRRLLLFSRREQGHTRAIDLNAVIAHAEPLLRRTLPENIELVVATEPAGCIVEADPGQLEQVLMNLVINARDAMPTGGRLKVASACVRDGEAGGGELASPGYGALIVEDTGEGMPPEVLDRAFDPFFTTREGGTGLGLAVVYGVAREAGGHVSLSAEPGRGTTATVRLPLAGRPEDAPAAARPGGPVPRGTGELVLVAEDSGALRDLTRRLLEDGGYRVAAADSGAAALACGQTEPPDLLLSDVVMPGMSGRDLAEALRTRRPGLPVVLMSGYTDDVVLRHGLLGTGTAFMEKPFTRAQLLRTVRAALDG